MEAVLAKNDLIADENTLFYAEFSSIAGTGAEKQGTLLQQAPSH